MREMISECSCHERCASTYRTPWCDMLKKKESCSVLHLWYNLDMMRREIEKRSSYLGKFRRTEEAQHLLDLIAMTSDEDNMFVPFAKAAMADVFEELVKFMPDTEKAYFWREGQETLEFTDVPSAPVPALNFYSGQYVLYNGDLYMAIEDGDTDDFSTKIVPTEDYRESIHYGILWSCSSNINVVEPLDVAIFEALVARILHKWLRYAYPAEAANYLDEYNEHLAAVKKRVNLLDPQPIAHRRPSII